jgi:hypothetical protein
MKTKLFTMMAAVATLATLATGCDKPDETPSCLIGRGLWIAKYTKVTETGTASDCRDRQGELLNINKYQAFPQQGQPAPISSVAIKPYSYRYARLTDAPDATADATTRTDLALGAFQSNSASNNICTIPTLSTASETTKGGSFPFDVDVKGVPTSYIFTNVQFLDDRTHPGQQMQADLEFHRGGCVQTYKVLALFELNALTGLPQMCTEQADCDPHADPNDPTRLININGSGINPDYPVYCDTALGTYASIGGIANGVFGAPIFAPDTGVCFLDGDFQTTCDSASNPNCWKSGPKGSAAP